MWLAPIRVLSVTFRSADQECCVVLTLWLSKRRRIGCCGDQLTADGNAHSIDAGAAGVYRRAAFAEVRRDALPRGMVSGQHAPLRPGDDDIARMALMTWRISSVMVVASLAAGMRSLDTIPLTVGSGQ